MAVTVEMRTQVEQLYVALFNRAPDAEGLGYWSQRMAAGDSVVDIANTMYATEPARKTYPLYLTNEEIVTAFYVNVLGREPDAEGKAYWTAQLNGSTPGEVIAQMINVVVNYDGEDEAGLASTALFNNKVAVADYFVKNVGTINGSDTALSGVTADPDSVDAAQEAINGSGAAPTVDTQLTVDWNNLSGTAGNDTFKGWVVQNSMGAQVNQLGSGDRIDGKGGTDVLDAKITAGVFAGGSYSMPIHPETTSVEIVRLGAMEADIGYYYGGGYGEDLNTEVYVNAQNMYGVNEISSYYSDADLSILNMTTLASDGATMRNVSDMTVSMVHTGNSDSRWGASDMAVLFDQDYLVPVESSKSTAFFWLLDEDADLAGLPNRLDHINVDGLRFRIDGGPIVTLAAPEAQTAGTHAGFVAALQDALAALIADGVVPADTTLTLDTTNTNTTYLDNGAQSLPVPAIVLHTDSSVTIEPVGYSQVPDALGEYDVWGRFDNEVQTEQNLSINVVLEKAGRAGDGGELQIGSMHKPSSGYNYDPDDDYETQYPDYWSPSYAKAGIPQFNVTVKGDASKPSSLSGLHSTNNVLEKIVVVTDAAVTGAKGYAALTIGNENSPYGEGIWDVETVDAGAFKGDFSLWAHFGHDSAVAGKYNGQVDLNYTFGSGNDYLSLRIDQPGTEVAKYRIAMGEGNDTVEIDLDADAVDAMTEAFSLDLGNGNNSASIWVDNTGGGLGDQDQNNTTYQSNGFTAATTNGLKNLSVVAGSGDDYVHIDGNDSLTGGTIANFNIKTGGGSDMVFIDAGGLHGREVVWNTGVHAIPIITGSPTVMYKGQVQLRYAGFESTAAIDSGSDFILTTQELNNALIKALEANPELARMLGVDLASGNQALDVLALIDGNNLLEVTVYQPELIATGPASNGQVIVASNDIPALGAALIKANAALTSSDVDTAAEIVTQFTAHAAGKYVGPVAPNSDGVNGWTFYVEGHLEGEAEGTVANSSTINMGAGANDLAVLSSNDASSNTLVFDAAWGKVSIVNFFTDENVLVNGDTGTNGAHKLNFTAFLNHKTSASGSVMSQKAIAIEAADGTAGTASFKANNIVFTNVDGLETAAGGATNYSFGSLTAAQVEAALEAAGGFTYNAAVADFVGTTQTSLLIVENIDDVSQNTIAGVSGTDNYANHGEYKVFQIQYSKDVPTGGAAEDYTVTLLGTLDFGNSLDIAAIIANESTNLTGGFNPGP